MYRNAGSEDIMSELMRWVEVDASAAARNLQFFKKRAPRVMAVVKAECYGHGRALARVFEDAGADWLAAAAFSEARDLRADGITIPILVLGQVEAEDAAAAAALGVTLEVGSEAFASALSRAAVRAGVAVDCHLKLDTGMGRIGFDVTRPDVLDAIERTCALPGLRFTGVFQHFAVADEAAPESDAFTRTQFDRFTGTLDALRARGITFPLRHCCNSAAALRFPEYALDMVRAGISLYGLPAGDAGAPGLEPVLAWKARVTQVKRILPGQSVSYGREFVAKRPTDVATVSLGYADGYRRLLAGKGCALIRGKRARLLGRVCMDQIMLDVTGIGAETGDEAVFIGRSGEDELTCTEMARALGTIEYEVTCLIGGRCARVMHRGG